MGYRYYDTKKMPVLFPFGYGLSYTEFAYSGLTLSAQSIRDTETVTVSVTVKNVGQRAGQEVVQLYVRDVESSVIRPDKELKGFAKVQLSQARRRQSPLSLTNEPLPTGTQNSATGMWRQGVWKSWGQIFPGYRARSAAGGVNGAPEKDSYPQHQDRRHSGRSGAWSGVQECAQEYNLGGTLRDSGEDPALSKLMQSLFTNSDLRLLLNFSAGSFTEQQLSELLDRLNAAVK